MSSVVIAFLVPIVLAALGGAVRSQARASGNEHVVEYGWGLRGFALLMTALAVGIMLVALFLSPSDRPWILGISGMFALLAAFFLPHAYGTRFAFGPTGIRALSPWRKAIFVPWEQIANVTYSPGEASYVVLTSDRIELKLHAYMSGVPDLLAEMQRRDVRGAALAQATVR